MKTLEQKAMQISDRVYHDSIVPVDLMIEGPRFADDYAYFIGGGDYCEDVDASEVLNND